MFGVEVRVTMNRKAVVLLSGGLDSTLATCIVKEQGVEIEAVNFQTMFGCCKDDARQVAHRLGVPFTLLKVGDDYLKTIQFPKYGYGRGINPCVDCRIYMFLAAKRFMEEVGASFMISGEVLGQRPMSQKLRDFQTIERDAGLERRILRPLSAKLLSPTLPEELGIVDRSKLYAVEGRSRQELLALAGKYGIENPPSPSSGCALTSPAFAEKVQDIFDHRPEYERWEFELLKTGRHFRLDGEAKVIIARDENENAHLELRHPAGTHFLKGVTFVGPCALVIGKAEEKHFRSAGRLMLRYAQKPVPESGEIEIHYNGGAGAGSPRPPLQGEGTSPLRMYVPSPMSELEVNLVRIV